jgi:hypothetical protein
MEVAIMPRKTKEQLMEEREAARLAAQEKERAEYFPRLVDLLHRATKAGFIIEVRDNNFAVLSESWTPRQDQHKLPVEWNENAMNAFYSAEVDVDDALWKIQEKERKAAVRQAALAKLTDEERKELGIKA